MTQDVHINELREGDTVLAINGKARPFPYTVARVINMQAGHNIVTRVDYAHGGIILPCDPKTAVATITRDES